MENEIKVGEYVRTKDGQIYKIEDGTEFYEDSVNVGIGIIPEVDGIWVDKEHFTYVDKTNIVKHSHNLIDLIQCGDYVNGIRVKQWFKGVYTKEIELENGYKIDTVNSLGKIKTVVTKEMMGYISYKVKE